MLWKLYTVKDVKADLCMPPVASHNHGTMMRTISDSLRANADHPHAKHPEDYVLYELGTYDDNSGVIKACEAPLSICVLSDLSPKGGN